MNKKTEYTDLLPGLAFIWNVLDNQIRTQVMNKKYFTEYFIGQNIEKQWSELDSEAQDFIAIIILHKISN